MKNLLMVGALLLSTSSAFADVIDAVNVTERAKLSMQFSEYYKENVTHKTCLNNSLASAVENASKEGSRLSSNDQFKISLECAVLSEAGISKLQDAGRIFERAQLSAALSTYYKGVDLFANCFNDAFGIGAVRASSRNVKLGTNEAFKLQLQCAIISEFGR